MGQHAHHRRRSTTQRAVTLLAAATALTAAGTTASQATPHPGHPSTAAAPTPDSREPAATRTAHPAGTTKIDTIAHALHPDPAPRPHTAATQNPTDHPAPAPAPVPGPIQVAPLAAWEVTVYYTAVESYHHMAPEHVAGCLQLDCRRGEADLGTYPEDFVTAVHDEGTGRITSGVHAGQYLNWSSDTGFWLDTAPRDSYGGILQPFRSAAADTAVLPRGSHFTITGCGSDEGDPIDPAVCSRLRATPWQVVDQFTPGLGGSGHVDVYLGEENTSDFSDSPWYTTLQGATLTTR